MSVAADPSFSAWLLDGKINVYRPPNQPNAATKKRPDSAPFALLYVGVPAHFTYTQNDDDPSGIGRIKRRSALTEDGIIVDWRADVKSGDLIKNVDSGDAANFGAVYRVESELRKYRGVGSWAELGFAQLMEMPKPPAEVL